MRKGTSLNQIAEELQGKVQYYLLKIIRKIVKAKERMSNNEKDN